MNDIERLKQIVEGALLAAGQPLDLKQLSALFPPEEQPGHGPLREALAALDADCETRGVELKEVASGYRLQVRDNVMPWVSRLWAEKPPRYSRAMLETLAIIAYRQPITRGEIEQIRGVAVSSNILRTLQEREWIRTLGHRDVPGRPELLGTTREFLDYFNLKSLDELPTLAEIKDLDNLEPELELRDPEAANDADAGKPDDNTGTAGAEDPNEHQQEESSEAADDLRDPAEQAGGDDGTQRADDDGQTAARNSEQPEFEESEAEEIADKDGQPPARAGGTG